MVEEGGSDVVQVSEKSEEAAPQLIVPHLSRKHCFKNTLKLYRHRNDYPGYFHAGSFKREWVEQMPFYKNKLFLKACNQAHI